MEVTPVGFTPPPQDGSAQTPSERTLELGQDAFMKLLLTQLKYQDPLSPMDDRDFIAQLAQFSSLSEMRELNEAVTQMATVQALASAAAFIGKIVSGISEAGEPVSGIAEAALLREGTVYVRVDGEDLPISTIQEVTLGGSDGQSDQ